MVNSEQRLNNWRPDLAELKAPSRFAPADCVVDDGHRNLIIDLDDVFPVARRYILTDGGVGEGRIALSHSNEPAIDDEIASSQRIKR